MTISWENKPSLTRPHSEAGSSCRNQLLWPKEHHLRGAAKIDHDKSLQKDHDSDLVVDSLTEAAATIPVVIFGWHIQFGAGPKLQKSGDSGSLTQNDINRIQLSIWWNRIIVMFFKYSNAQKDRKVLYMTLPHFFICLSGLYQIKNLAAGWCPPVIRWFISPIN